MIAQRSDRLSIDTNGPAFIDATTDIAKRLAAMGAREGLLTVFLRHTSASLTIQENADPAVQRDLLAALERFAPRDLDYAHASEGPDDMPSHVKAMVTSTALSIPVLDGRMALGTWQGVYLVEHRDAPRRREIVLQFLGEVDR